MRVFLPSTAALAVLSLSALLADSADAKLRLNGWFPCGFSASAPGAAPAADAPPAEKLFECGEVDVPLCHDGVCESDRTIPIFVKRLMANATTTTPVKSLWMLQGGPGGSSVALETSMQAIQRQLDYTANVYTMDHRGTGRSFFLQCDAAQAFTSGSPSGVGLSPDELPDCLRDILFQIDNQTAAFSVTSAAKDMEYLVQELHTDDEEVYVYGASYGTYLTERLMHLEPPKVKGYVLDGVMAEDDPTFTTRNADNIIPSKRLATYCQEDPKCAAMFLDGKHGAAKHKAKAKDKEEDAVYHAWQKIYSDLDQLKQGENACADLFRFSTLGDAATEVSSTVKFSLSSYTMDPSLRVLLPGLLQLIHRCEDDNDLLTIQTIQKLVQSAGGGGNSAAIAKAVTTHSRKLQDAPTPVAPTPQAVDVIGGTSTILMFLMKVSELWTFPSPTWSDEMKSYKEGVFSQPMVADYAFHCLYSGNQSDPSCDVLDDASRLYGADLTTVEPVKFAYDMDEYWGDYATIPDHASVLVINGKLDFQTMSDNGVRQFENMEGGQGKLLVEMDYGGHCTGIVPSTVDDKSECGYRIIASFVEQSGSVLDVDTSCLEELPSMTFFSGDMIIDTFLKNANGGAGGEMEAGGEESETEKETEEEEEETGVKKVAKAIKAKAKKTTTTTTSTGKKSTKGFRLP